MIFNYSGDQGSRTLAWLQRHLKGISLCIDNALPERALTLIYSGLDTLGFLGASSDVSDASRSTFLLWCETYILPRVQSVEGHTLTAVDLYAARCGVLHTSTPESPLGRKGDAREIWYQFREKTGINLLCNLSIPSLTIDVEVLALAFRNAALAFLSDIQQDPMQERRADGRAQHFLRWGTAKYTPPIASPDGRSA